MSTTPKTHIVKLYGNLGNDPKLRTTRDRVISRSVYDPIIDDAVEREYTRPGRELRTLRLAVNGRDSQGIPLPTRWHTCVDWHGLTATYRKGDRVALTGFFKPRQYQKDGQTEEVRELVITHAQLLHIKTRQEAA